LISCSARCSLCNGRTELATPVGPLSRVIKTLISLVYHDTASDQRPTLADLYPAVDQIPVPVLFSDPMHPAAQPGYVDAVPTQRATKVKVRDVEKLVFTIPASDRWYVVIRGVGFHGVVHGAVLWSSMVPGHKHSKGSHLPTRAQAESAYRSAFASGEVWALPSP
jgi:hypothetical protein